MLPTFPITVDSGLSSAEQPNKYGPYLSGGALYEVLVSIDNDAGTVQLVVVKSSDAGVTWAQVDAGNGPMALWSQNLINTYSACQGGSKLYAVYIDDEDSSQFLLSVFDCSTDTWGAVSDIPSPPNTGSAYYNSYQQPIAYSALDNTLILVMAADFVNGLGDVTHQICTFNRYSIAGDTWGSWEDLGYQDYADITDWNQVPCGLVVDPATGKAVVFMQQVSIPGPGTQQEFSSNFIGSGTFTVPADADSPATFEATGGGGGCSAIDGAAAGGGGAGYSKATTAWAPGDTFNYTVGAGGAPASDGDASSFGPVSADGGKTGTDQVTGGLGGAGSTASGGQGGVPGTFTGGGGGGAGSADGNGADGSPGSGSFGGDGGTPGGGSGGNLDFYGSDGGNGGGAGGDGNGVTPDPTRPNGGTGSVVVSWFNIRNTHDSRMWQQVINPDNTLGTLTEIPQGTYPSPGGSIPVSFDAVIFNGVVSIAFTGVTATSGRDNIMVGSGALANPVNFAFSSIPSGNGGNELDSYPCLAATTGQLYCCFISSPNNQPIAFKYSLNSGTPVTIGTLNTGNVHSQSRLQAVFLNALCITYGTPTSGNLAWEQPE